MVGTCLPVGTHGGCFLMKDSWVYLLIPVYTLNV